MRLALKIFCGVNIFLCLFSQSCALPTDNEQPVHIVADSSMMNYKTGFNVYEGHVKIQQGSTVLTADKVTTQKNKLGKMHLAIAYGINKLAEYITVPKAGDATFHAKAHVIKFYPQKSLAILIKNVIVTQGENSFRGAYVIYDKKNQIITAPPSPKSRSVIIIDPKQ